MKNPVHFLSLGRKSDVPMIRQSEVAECGLACVAMVASYYGHNINLTMLRRKYSTSIKGTNLNTLAEIAGKLNLSSRALKVNEISQLRNLRAPCVLHWDFKHFVVLTRITRKGIMINDPAKGEVEVSNENAEKFFTGIALELFPTSAFEKKDEELTMKLSDLWGSISGLKKAFFQIFSLSLILQLFALISPLFMQLVIDNVVIGGNTDLLKVLGLGFGLLVVVTVGTNLLRSFIIMFLGNQLNIQINAKLFHHLLRLPLQFFERRHIGDVVSRFQSIDKIRTLITTGIIEAVVDGLLVIMTLILMFTYSSVLSWLVLLSIALYGIVRWLMYPAMRLYTEESIITRSKERTNFLETIRAIQSIKLFNREPQRESVWHNRYADNMNAEIRLRRQEFLFVFAKDFILGMENVLIIYIGALAVIDNSLSVGMLFAFITYKIQFTTKSSAIIDKLMEFKMLKLHLGRIADIALSPTEKSDGETDTPTTLDGSLSLEGLSFRYAPNEPVLLDEINFDFTPGESVAIIGASGCGKTTLMKIMLGLLEPASGNVTANGVNISSLGLAQYRSQISTVMQNDQLLSGTMIENISFFASEPDSDLVIQVAKLAYIHEDILAMPMGYNSLVGDMGTVLSGGQKQRLLLARALYGKPKILLLDEATSHLDQKLEAKVNSSIKALNITRIIIAHRKETILSADRIVQITDGKIKEIGKSRTTK